MLLSGDVIAGVESQTRRMARASFLNVGGLASAAAGAAGGVAASGALGPLGGVVGGLTGMAGAGQSILIPEPKVSWLKAHSLGDSTCGDSCVSYGLM